MSVSVEPIDITTVGSLNEICAHGRKINRVGCLKCYPPVQNEQQAVGGEMNHEIELTPDEIALGWQKRAQQAEKRLKECEALLRIFLTEGSASPKDVISTKTRAYFQRSEGK